MPSGQEVDSSSSFTAGASGRQDTLADVLDPTKDDSSQDSVILVGQAFGEATSSQASQFSDAIKGGIIGEDFMEGMETEYKQSRDEEARQPNKLVEDDEHRANGSIRELALQNGRAVNVEREAGVYRTGYVYSSYMTLHAHPSSTLWAEKGDDDEVGEKSHPERPERIMRIHNVLKKAGCLHRMMRIPIREITKAEVILVHDEGVWDGLERTSYFSPETLALEEARLERSSLYLNESSAFCARLSCGGVVEMCDAVASGRVQNGFAIVRPPGHHAEPDAQMGFCFYNNVAVAAAFLKQKYGKRNDEQKCKRILILDWDVHHGNGTQKAFWDDEDVLYISLHRYENGSFYPGGAGGSAAQVGGEGAKGRNINIPWPEPGMGDQDYLSAFRRIVSPIASEFAPDFVIISAGFDAARGDPLGECDVTPAGYAQMTYDLARLANGRLVVALEGGYQIDAIAASALQVTNVLLGAPPAALEPGAKVCSPAAIDALRQVEHIQADYWQCMQRDERYPDEGQDAMATPEAPDADAALSKIKLSQLLTAYRIQEVAERFQLSTLPLADAISEFEDQGVVSHIGQCLCSPDLFEETSDGIVLFAHDMGNLRVEPGWASADKSDVLTMVDASAKVIEWAQSKNLSLIDICLPVEAPLQPTRANARPRQRAQDSAKGAGANALLLQVWDQCISLQQKQNLKVVLIGFGSACMSIMHLIEKRNVMSRVCAIVQLPFQGTVPATQKLSKKRKWYFKTAQIYLPGSHYIFDDEPEWTTAKRFGQLIRSNEARAIHVLRAEFAQIDRFLTASLAKQRKATANQPSGGVNGSGHPDVEMMA